MIPRYTVRIDDPADDPGALADALGELERRCGCAVSCDALDGRLRRQRRDQLLREALGLLSGTPWARCTQLEGEIRRFEAVLWPHWRDHDALSEGCSALRRHIFQARRLGPLPSTARQLWNIIVKCGGPGDFGEKAVQSP